MSRSIWKGPFVDPSLLKKVEKLKGKTDVAPIKTWSRRCTIIPEFVGYSFLIYNGKKFIPIKISDEMVGHKLGEFSPTRQFSGHTPADKKAAQEAAKARLAPPIPAAAAERPSKRRRTIQGEATEEATESGDIIKELKELKKLYDEGILTKEQFEKAKDILLYKNY